MQVPLEVSFRDVAKTDSLDALIQELAERLERFCDHIDSCRVAVECSNAHPQTFRELRVRIDLTVPPGHEIVVTRESAGGFTHDSVDALVRDAFHIARKRLIRLKDLQRGHSRPTGRGAAGPEQDLFAEPPALLDSDGDQELREDEDDPVLENDNLGKSDELLEEHP